MTLQQFLTVTAEISDRDLRPALALALSREVPRTQHSYARFYRRVIEELAVCGEARPSGILESQPATNGHVSSAAPGWLVATREHSHQGQVLQGMFTH